MSTTYRIRDWAKHFENAASRKLTRLNWVAIPNKVDGEGYTALVDHPNAAAHLGAWYAIVEAASKQDPRGALPGGIPQDIGGICRSLGRMSRLPAAIFEQVIPRLVTIGWLEEVQSNQQEVTALAESPNIVAESADALGESADIVAAHRREWNGITGNGTEEKNTFALAPSDAGVVRPPVPTFEDFWRVWWNKTAKADAQKAWPAAARSHGAEFLISQAVSDRERFEPTEDWSWRAKLHPATWLRGRRWEDQTPLAVVRKPNGRDGQVDRILSDMNAKILKGESPL